MAEPPKYQCYHCGSPMRVIFSQTIYTYSKKKSKQQEKHQCVPICCVVCGGRIARKVEAEPKPRTVKAV